MIEHESIVAIEPRLPQLEQCTQDHESIEEVRKNRTKDNEEHQVVEQAKEREEAETASQSESESKADSELESEPDEMEDVTEFEHDGVTYYRGADNALYDPETEECVGKWDGEKVVPMA